MRRTWLVGSLAVIVAAGRGSAAEEEQAARPPLPADAARMVIGRDAKAFEALRAALRDRPVADALDVLSRVRAEVRGDGPGSLVTDFVPPLADAPRDHDAEAEAIEAALAPPARAESHVGTTLFRAPLRDLRAVLGASMPGEVGGLAPVAPDDARRTAAYASALGAQSMRDVDLVDGQAVRLRSTATFSYVADYDVTVSQSICDVTPDAGRIEDGVVVDLVLVRGERGLELEASVAWSAIASPLPRLSTFAWGDRDWPITLQTPTTEVRTGHGRAAAAEGGWYALIAAADANASEVSVALIHVVVPR